MSIWIERDYSSRIREDVKSRPVVLLTGIRQARKDIFYYRDTNGVEIDFVIEKKGEVFLVEAKHSERPNPDKLNFRKIAPLFSEKVNSLLACTTKEKGLITLRDYAVYNPLFGSIP